MGTEVLLVEQTVSSTGIFRGFTESKPTGKVKERLRSIGYRAFHPKRKASMANTLTGAATITPIQDPLCHYFPDKGIFEQVCQRGLSVVRPLRREARSADPEGWNFGSAKAPSYYAYGRLRALLTLNLARSLKPKRVLEIAAGDAALCACLEQAGCDVVANDLRRENIKRSVAYFENRQRIRIVPGNVYELHPDVVGQFDLVIACEIIEHVAHASALLKHLRRFLCPGGRILLTTPNGAYFRNKLPTHSEIEDFEQLETREFKPDSDGHLFLITPAEMRQIAKQAGLEVENMMLWGTPFITGESGFRVLGPIPLPYYDLEVLSQNFWESIKERLCNAMTVILR